MKYFILITMLFVGFTACQSRDYYTRRAVDEARDYITKNLRDLTEYELDYVRFTPPSISQKDIFITDIGDSDFSQSMIYWKLPEKDELVWVVGTGDRNFFEWYPIRAMRKTINSQDGNKASALKIVRDYAMFHLLHLDNDLSVNEQLRDRIRFAPPVVLESNFNMNEEKRQFDDVDILEMPKPESLQEFSFVWQGIHKDQWIAITGIANKDFSQFSVKGWKIRNPNEFENTAIRHLGFEEIRTENNINSSEQPLNGIVVLPSEHKENKK